MVDQPHPSPDDISINHFWESFSRNVLAYVPNGSVQYREMRKAFYAGFHVCLSTCVALGSGDITEDCGIAVLKLLQNEARRFAEDVRDGIIT